MIEKFKMGIDSLDQINTIGFAFWFSTVLLIVISIIKYFIMKKGNIQKDIGELIMELPIDICNIVITILVSLYLSEHMGKGIIFIMITIFVIAICAIFRRLSIDRGGFEHLNVLPVFYALVDIALAMMWIKFVLNTIKL